ncbi:hypothetical protein D3C75_879790 [compost metagenome]
MHAVAVDIGYVTGGKRYLAFAGGLVYPLRAQLLGARYIAGYQCLAGLADHGQGMALGIGYLCAEWQRAAICQLQGKDHAQDLPAGEAGFDDRAPARHNLLRGIVDDDFRREIVSVQYQRIQPVGA